MIMNVGRKILTCKVDAKQEAEDLCCGVHCCAIGLILRI